MTEPVDHLAFLTANTRKVCDFAKMIKRMPEDAQVAIESVMSKDSGVSANRMRELLRLYMSKVPGETTVRRHRHHECVCYNHADKETT